MVMYAIDISCCQLMSMYVSELHGGFMQHGKLQKKNIFKRNLVTTGSSIGRSYSAK
jgi:hypothetical protein